MSITSKKLRTIPNERLEPEKHMNPPNLYFCWQSLEFCRDVASRLQNFCCRNPKLIRSSISCSSERNSWFGWQGPIPSFSRLFSKAAMTKRTPKAFLVLRLSVLEVFPGPTTAEDSCLQDFLKDSAWRSLAKQSPCKSHQITASAGEA